MKRLFPILSVITAAFLAYALYQALVVAPADAQQGEVYRIIYYHVPSAWTAFLLFFINFIASIQYLVSAKPSTKKAAKWIVIAIGVVGVIVMFLPQVKAVNSGRNASERGGDDGVADSGVLFPDRKIVSRVSVWMFSP